MRRLLALAVAVVGGVVAVQRLLPSKPGRPDRPSGATVRHRIMARLLDRLPPDSPPKLVMSILPRLQQQNDEIIALLREQNELLGRSRLQPVTRESKETA